MHRRLGLACLSLTVLFVFSCRREPTASLRSGRAAPSASGSATTVAHGSASALASAPSASGNGAAPLASASLSAPVAHCKALGKSGLVSLGVASSDRPQLFAEHGYVYVLGFTHELARVKLSRISRAGAKVQALAEQKGLGDPIAGPVLNGWVYYTQAGNLFRLGGEPGKSERLYERAHSPVAHHGDRLFFIECDRKGRLDRLMEMALSGGPARSLAELEHAPGSRCEYSSLAADEREVLIADWRGQRILAISRQDGAQRVLLKRRGFPKALILEPRALTFLSTRGLERVNRDGENAELLVKPELVIAPYSSAFLSGAEYWLTDDIAYATLNHLYRRPHDGGELRSVATFRIIDPLAENPGDEALVGFAVDEECAYLARVRAGRVGTELLAIAK